MTEAGDEEELEADACSQAAPRDLQVSPDRSDYWATLTPIIGDTSYPVHARRSALRTSSEIQYLPSFEFVLTVKATLYYRPTKT